MFHNLGEVIARFLGVVRHANERRRSVAVRFLLVELLLLGALLDLDHAQLGRLLADHEGFAAERMGRANIGSFLLGALKSPACERFEWAQKRYKNYTNKKRNQNRKLPLQIHRLQNVGRRVPVIEGQFVRQRNVQRVASAAEEANHPLTPLATNVTRGSLGEFVLWKIPLISECCVRGVRIVRVRNVSCYTVGIVHIDE